MEANNASNASTATITTQIKKYLVEDLPNPVVSDYHDYTCAMDDHDLYERAESRAYDVARDLHKEMADGSLIFVGVENGHWYVVVVDGDRKQRGAFRLIG